MDARLLRGLRGRKARGAGRLLLLLALPLTVLALLCVYLFDAYSGSLTRTRAFPSPSAASPSSTRPTPPSPSSPTGAGGAEGAAASGPLPAPLPALAELPAPDGCTAGKRRNRTSGLCHWMTEVDVVADLPLATLTEYFAAGRPVVLRGGEPVSQWAALRKWTMQHLQEEYGNVSVVVQAGRTTRPDFETSQHLLRQRLPLAEYLRLLQADGPANDVYLTSNNKLFLNPGMQALLDDLEPFWPARARRSMFHTYFWLGPAGTVTPLHFDEISLLHTHLQGTKTWHLLAPEWRPYLCNDYTVYSPVDVRRADTSAGPGGCPLYRHAAPHVLTVTLHAADTLFIPAGWWHSVYSEATPTMSVSTNAFVAELQALERRLQAHSPIYTTVTAAQCLLHRSRAAFLNPCPNQTEMAGAAAHLLGTGHYGAAFDVFEDLAHGYAVVDSSGLLRPLNDPLAEVSAVKLAHDARQVRRAAGAEPGGGEARPAGERAAEERAAALEEAARGLRGSPHAACSACAALPALQPPADPEGLRLAHQLAANCSSSQACGELEGLEVAVLKGFLVKLGGRQLAPELSREASVAAILDHCSELVRKEKQWGPLRALLNAPLPSELAVPAHEWQADGVLDRAARWAGQAGRVSWAVRCAGVAELAPLLAPRALAGLHRHLEAHTRFTQVWGEELYAEPPTLHSRVLLQLVQELEGTLPEVFAGMRLMHWTALKRVPALSLPQDNATLAGARAQRLGLRTGERALSLHLWVSEEPAEASHAAPGGLRLEQWQRSSSQHAGGDQCEDSATGDGPGERQKLSKTLPWAHNRAVLVSSEWGNVQPLWFGPNSAVKEEGEVVVTLYWGLEAVVEAVSEVEAE